MALEHARLSEEEHAKAAEAVVEAASWCHLLRIGEELPLPTRKVLLRALTKDPSLTEELLRYCGLQIQ